MKLVGHTTIGMTEYYNKQVIDESLAGSTGVDGSGEIAYIRGCFTDGGCQGSSIAIGLDTYKVLEM
jgi:hypothetical protein